MVVIGYYQAENFKVFQALSKTNIPYAFNASGTYLAKGRFESSPKTAKTKTIMVE